jgi:hypothetical protein
MYIHTYIHAHIHTYTEGRHALHTDGTVPERHFCRCSQLHTYIHTHIYTRDVVLYIQMELCQNGSLADALKKESRIVDPRQNMEYIVGVLRGLQHIHGSFLCCVCVCVCMYPFRFVCMYSWNWYVCLCAALVSLFTTYMRIMCAVFSPRICVKTCSPRLF